MFIFFDNIKTIFETDNIKKKRKDQRIRHASDFIFSLLLLTIFNHIFMRSPNLFINLTKKTNHMVKYAA